jgi:DNA-binding CsgD family transcriptional regulator
MINHFDARDPAGRAPALPPDVLVGLRRHNFARSRTYVAQSSVGGRQFSYRASMLKTNPELRSSATDAYIAVLILQGCQSESDALLEVSRRFGLTEREREAVEYLISSLSTKEIAERMEISPNTVKSFLRLAMIKLGVSNRTGILMKIFKQSEPPGEPVAKAVAASNVPY